MRIDRMLTITIMLLNRERISARELADYFEVSVRTIYRDIDAINMAGIPIISFSGNNGGFGILKNYKIDRQLLTLNDMISIVSSLKGINATFENKGIDTAIEKITNLIPEDKVKELETHNEQYAIDILPWGYRSREKKHLKTIHKAISELRLLQITYRNYDGILSKRKIEPMTLIFKGYAFYIFGYCQKKKDFRIFKLSRISNPEILEETFIRREKSYQDIMKNTNNDTKLTTVKLKFDPSMRTRVDDYFYPEQVEFLNDGFMIVTADFPIDDWFYSIVLGYGESVEILEPAEIRSILVEKTKNILKKYQT